MSDYLDFMRERLGANWVLARRTSRILRQYGDDVNCISQKQYRKVERDYRELHGDPYDKVRRDMYLALVQARSLLVASSSRIATATPQYKKTIAAISGAIAAELDRP